MKLILHIGNHKCGSTSIQHALFAKREKLLNAGTLYPKSGLIGCAHHNLAFSVKGQATGFSSAGNQPKNFGHYIKTITDEANYNSIETIVVSSEEFMTFSVENIDSIKKHMRIFDRVIIIAYLRNQVDLIESAYKFNVLWDATSETLPFKDRIHKAINRTHHEYDKRLKYWSEVHPNTEVIAKDFHQEIKDSLIKSFFSEIGFTTSSTDNSATTMEVMNASLTRLGTLILRNNNINPSHHSRNAVIQTIKKLEVIENIDKKHKLYTLDTLNKTTDRFFASNVRLHQDFGVNLNESMLNFDISLCMGDEYLNADQDTLCLYKTKIQLLDKQ